MRHADNLTQRASNRGSQVGEVRAKRFLFRVSTEKKLRFVKRFLFHLLAEMGRSFPISVLSILLVWFYLQPIITRLYVITLEKIIDYC